MLRTDFDEIFSGSGPKTNRLHFGDDRDLDTDPGSWIRIYQDPEFLLSSVDDKSLCQVVNEFLSGV